MPAAPPSAITEINGSEQLKRPKNDQSPNRLRHGHVAGARVGSAACTAPPMAVGWRGGRIARTPAQATARGPRRIP
eukprot:4338232-Prymnesium_polylepis.1